MATTIKKTSQNLNTRSLHRKNGCMHINSSESLKMRLLNGLGLPDDKYSKKVFEMLNDEKESITNKIYAIRSLVRLSVIVEEDSLVRLVSQKDSRLGFAVLKTLAINGTEKTYETLVRTEELPYKYLERQKDYTLLMIGYRHQIANTDKILGRLLKVNPLEKKGQELQLGFQTMTPHDISEVLKQSVKTNYGFSLSGELALEVKVGEQIFYFCFSTKFDDPTTWNETLSTKHVFGQVLRKEKLPGHASPRFIALATPMNDHSQIGIFKKNGDLLMLLKLTYDSRKNTFFISNMTDDRTRTVAHKVLSLAEKMFISLKLSSIRCHKKRRTATI